MRLEIDEACRTAYEQHHAVDRYSLFWFEETDWVCALGVTVPPHAGPGYKRLYVELIAAAFSWSKEVAQARVRFVIASDAMAHTYHMWYAIGDRFRYTLDLSEQPEVIPVVCLAIHADKDHMVGLRGFKEAHVLQHNAYVSLTHFFRVAHCSGSHTPTDPLLGRSRHHTAFATQPVTLQASLPYCT